MKRLTVFVMTVLLTVFASAALADNHGKTGKLLLFQKCDAGLIGAAGYDSVGCPLVGTGPWPAFLGNHREGKLKYSPFGKKFSFSFTGRGLLPKKSYTLIYYPDPWPGSGLICLGSGKSSRGGSVEIHAKKDLGTGLPASYDANFNPVAPSGAVGAKIWLVLSDDVQCTAPTQLLGWNPTDYLFEYNLIVYDNRDLKARDRDDD
ncbi:MAG TPA: hypothetical protein VI078_16200 [bacterium]